MLLWRASSYPQSTFQSSTRHTQTQELKHLRAQKATINSPPQSSLVAAIYRYRELLTAPPISFKLHVDYCYFGISASHTHKVTQALKSKHKSPNTRAPKTREPEQLYGRYLWAVELLTALPGLPISFKLCTYSILGFQPLTLCQNMF